MLSSHHTWQLPTCRSLLIFPIHPGAPAPRRRAIPNSICQRSTSAPCGALRCPAEPCRALRSPAAPCRMPLTRPRGANSRNIPPYTRRKWLPSIEVIFFCSRAKENHVLRGRISSDANISYILRNASVLVKLSPISVDRGNLSQAKKVFDNFFYFF